MDVESVNCKNKLSQNTDVDLLCNIERPLKIANEITGLQKLVEELHKVFSYEHVNIQDVQKIMAGYKSDPKDWKKYAKFDRFRYTRNLVDAGNGAFNVMILCWGPGHASAIHDHADSHCFMKLLGGSLEEIRYDWPKTAEPEVFRKLRDNNKPRRRCCSASDDKITDKALSLCQNQNCDNFGRNIEDFQNGRHVSENNNCENGWNKDCVNNGKTEQNGQQNGKDELHNGNSELHNGNSKLKNGDDKTQNGEEKIHSDELNAESMKEIGRTRLEVNDVCYINDALGLHRMENPSHVDGAVSLHLYCPPFDACRVFDARTGKPTRVPVTFWSTYGKKVQRVIEANPIADSQ